MRASDFGLFFLSPSAIPILYKAIPNRYANDLGQFVNNTKPCVYMYCCNFAAQ